MRHLAHSIGPQGEAYWFKLGSGNLAAEAKGAKRKMWQSWWLKQIVDVVGEGEAVSEGGGARCVEGWDELVRTIRLPELLRS